MNKQLLKAEVIKWLSKSQYWLQYLGDKILSGEAVDASAIDTAYALFLEDNKVAARHLIRQDLFAGSEKVEVEEDNQVLLLKSIWDIQNVNALAENQTISFSDKITVLYGANGSGKTGYTRLLNDAFNTRGDKTILANIHKPPSTESHSAKFRFTVDGSDLDKNYPSDKHESYFKSFSVFDSQSVRVHLDDSNELCFVPQGFEFFKQLSNACGKVEELLQKGIQDRSKPNGFIAFFKTDGEAATAIRTLDSHLDFAYIERVCAKQEGEDELIQQLTKQKAELITLDSEKKAQEYSRIVKSLLSLKAELTEILGKTNDIYLKSLRDDIDAYKVGEVKTKALLSDQANMNHISHLNTEEWKRFIKAGHAFATLQSTDQGFRYPQESDPCIFCFQELKADSVDLIGSYWRIIQSNAEEELAACLLKIDKHKQLLEAVDFHSLRDDSFLTQWLHDHKKEVLVTWKSWVDAFSSVKNYILTSLTDKHWQEEIGLLSMDLESVDLVISEVKERIESLASTNASEKIIDLTSQINALEEKASLRTILASVAGYITDKAWVKAASSAASNLNTSKITRKQSELFDKLITGSYRDLFKEECNALEAAFDIEITQRGEKGKTLRKLKLGNFEPRKVLSEGEQRVISLADFLCEARMNPFNKGIIFDDPVTSLDHERKQTIAKRLAQEAQRRQVVIFTHDLVFLHYIEEEAKRCGYGYTCHWVKRSENETGSVFLDNSPSHQGEYKTTKKAEECYAKSKDAGPAEQEQILHQGFGALRTNYEYFVVFELFEGVVKRFDERISVGGLERVIVSDEIVKQIVDKSGDLSRFIDAHLHSDSYAANKPTPKNLREEIDAFLGLRKKLKELKSAKAKP